MTPEQEKQHPSELETGDREPIKKKYKPPAIKERLTITKETDKPASFHEIHDLMKEEGKLSDRIYKELHLDILFSPEDAARIFALHENEYNTVSKYLPKMVARSVFIVDKDLNEIFEEAKLQTRDTYTHGDYMWVLTEKVLAGRRSVDSTIESAEKSEQEKPSEPPGKLLALKAFRLIGQQIEKLRPKKFVGAIVQERINGISFAELFNRKDWKKDKNFLELQTKVKVLLAGLRTLHKEVSKAAFMWNTLRSDNVMVETDQEENLTGNVYVIDTNALTRPSKFIKHRQEQRLEQNIFAPLEEQFDLK